MHFFDERPPQGAIMAIEVEDVERMYRQVIEKGLPVRQELTTQKWGQSKLLRAGAEQTHAVLLQINLARRALGSTRSSLLAAKTKSEQQNSSYNHAFPEKRLERRSTDMDRFTQARSTESRWGA